MLIEGDDVMPLENLTGILEEFNYRLGLMGEKKRPTAENLVELESESGEKIYLIAAKSNFKNQTRYRFLVVSSNKNRWEKDRGWLRNEFDSLYSFEKSEDVTVKSFTDTGGRVFLRR
jgi:hypothetical protein